MNITSIMKTAKSVVTANSPVLLVGAAVAGIVSTGVLAARAGYKARGIVDQAEDDQGKVLNFQEKASLTWLCYASPVVTGASSIAAIVGVHTIHTKRHAALAGLYAMTSTKLDDYTEKAEELLGKKKTQDVQNAVSQQAVDRTDYSKHEVVILDGGTELCYDELSGRYFRGSVGVIESAVNTVNHQLLEGSDVVLNDFYDHLGLSTNSIGTFLGWREGDRLSVKFGSVIAPDGTPAVSFWFHDTPKDIQRSR